MNPHCHDRMLVGFTITCAISALLENSSWRGVLDTTLCDKVCQSLGTGRWFFPRTSVSSINKTDRPDITEILLNVALSTINQPPNQKYNHSIFVNQTFLVNVPEVYIYIYIKTKSLKIYPELSAVQPGLLQRNFIMLRYMSQSK